MEPVTPAIVPRSSLCPCGSGRRYKECHGAVRDPVAPERPAPRSSYRPKGPDWDHLAEDKRDACGQLMEIALRLQNAGEESEAERLYRDVLRFAPATHDALHMLGAINLRRGELFEAEKLIRQALRLRQEYAAIKKNLTLVEEAIHARQQGDVRVVCELALPLLADEVLRRTGPEDGAPALREGPSPAAASRSSLATHIISEFGDPEGETQWFALRVAALLSTQCPSLWSLRERLDSSPSSQPVRSISAMDRRLPVGGVQVLVGIDCDLEEWIEHAAPERLLVFGLAASSARYLQQLRRLVAGGAPPIELLFRSRADAARFGRAGPILVPPIELSEQQPQVEPRPPPAGDSFTLGTLARETRAVRTAADGKLLQALAGSACRLSVLDPGELRYALGANAAIEFHSRRELLLQSFLARIDAFLHTAPDPWAEGCGRGLFGAMARGLPVLCPRASLYAEYIEHERNGLLYSDKAEAAAWVGRLAADAQWAGVIGEGARLRAAELFDPARLAAAYGAVVEAAPVARKR